MADRTRSAPNVESGKSVSHAVNHNVSNTVANADWEGRDVSGESHTGVLFTDCDFTVLVNTGGTVTECSFRRVKFNASVHTDAAFVTLPVLAYD